MSAASGFITIEGVDGCGKTTLALALSDALRKAGHDVLVTREPGGTVGAEAIRDLLLDPPGNTHWSVWTQAMLFSAARRDHVEKAIGPALERGEWVICDRFVDSMHVYQARVDSAIRTALENGAIAGYRPDLTLIPDMPPGHTEMLAQQMDMFDPGSHVWPKSHTRDAVERTISHHALRDAFVALERVDRRRYRVLDARGGPRAVLAAALEVIRERFDLTVALAP